MDEKMNAAVERLHLVLKSSKNDEDVSKIINSKDEVILRYNKIFSKENVSKLDSEIFYGFLLFSNNKHWGGLYRAGKQITEHMDELRDVLNILLDENLELQKRIDYALPKEKARVKGLGKAILTAILLVSKPEKYGVWNSTSELGLKELNLWPTFDRGESNGSKFKKINDILNDISNRMNIDLWTLDALFWYIASHTENEDQDESCDDNNSDIKSEKIGSQENNFKYEKHLQDFLVDNWDAIEQFKDWDIFQSEGDIAGVEYIAGNIGRIDILASHKTEDRWLVIELKKSQTSDKTLGQILRYMGWVGENMATEKSGVEGLIIAGDFTEQMKYALKASKNIKLMSFVVNFELKSEIF